MVSPLTLRNGDQSTIAAYIHDVNETPLLSPEQEQILGEGVQEGDAEARDHLVRANLRLVIRIARGFVGRGVTLPDLIQEGNLGLIRAAQSFDPDMNTRFSTYASYWIKQSITRAVENCGTTIRVPSYAVDLVTKWRRAASDLQDRLGRTPSDQEIAKALGMTKKQAAIAKKALRIYCGQPSRSDSGPSMEELLTDDPSKSPDTQLQVHEEIGRVLQEIDCLDERESKVLKLRYGLNGENPMTLSGIGERLRLTRERVRQIERDALRKIRDRVCS